MFKIGQKVVCTDDQPVSEDCRPSMPLRLVLGAIYTVRAVQILPRLKGYGVRLEELTNPSIIWADGEECEWAYRSERFEPLPEVKAENWTTDVLLKNPA